MTYKIASTFFENGAIIHSMGFRDLSIDPKKKDFGKKQNFILRTVVLCRIYLVNIFSKVIPYFYLVILALITLPTILLLLVVGVFGISFMFGVVYVIRVSIYVLSAIVWLLSRPYIWLDRQVQQRKIESTRRWGFWRNPKHFSTPYHFPSWTASPSPTPARVTQTVGQFLAKFNREKIQ